MSSEMSTEEWDRLYYDTPAGGAEFGFQEGASPGWESHNEWQESWEEAPAPDLGTSDYMAPEQPESAWEPPPTPAPQANSIPQARPQPRPVRLAPQRLPAPAPNPAAVSNFNPDPAIQQEFRVAALNEAKKRGFWIGFCCGAAVFALACMVRKRG